MLDSDTLKQREVNIEKEVTYHRVRHSFKPEIIVPIAAITNNIDFLLCKGEKRVMTTDGVECTVESHDEIHMCKLEEHVKRLYNMDMWPFITRWYAVEPNMSSMEFVKMKLKKYEKV